MTHGHVDRGITHKYGSVEFLSKHIDSLFLILVNGAARRVSLMELLIERVEARSFYCKRDFISSGIINKL